jgi:hypothetical protein
VVKISACEPAFQGGAFIAGYQGAGFGHDKNERSLFVRLAFETATGEMGEAAIKAAKEATTKIELCVVDQNTNVPKCPGGDWVIWDNTNGAQKAEDFPWRVYDDPTVSRPELDRYLFSPITDLIDWQDVAQARKAIIVRVNGGGILSSDVAAGGACLNWTKLAEAQPNDTAKFTVIGTEVGTQDPFNFPGTPLDLCAYGVGSKVDWIWGSGAFSAPNPGMTACITKDQAEYVRRVLVSVDDSQQKRIQSQVATPESAWKNGKDASGNFLPSYLMLGPHFAFGQAYDLGIFRINVFGIRNIIPDFTADPTVQLAVGGAPDLPRITTHEFFHELQHTWARERPLSDPHLWHTNLSEGMASSVEGTLCLNNYPATAGPTHCVSSAKILHALNQDSGIFALTKSIFLRPERDVVTQPYESQIFWRYMMEQFSYPVGSPAHPTGTPSSIPHQNLPLNVRDSDEGVDFMGLAFEEYGKTPAGVATVDALDKVLQTNLGRSLDEVVFDFHTAMYLKDYNDSDPRWRFEWAGDFNALTPLEEKKPFDVPDNLYGDTPDKSPRAFRTVDSWGLCDSDLVFQDFVPKCVKYGTGPNPVPRPVLASNGSLASVVPVFLEPRGTTVVSVHPEAPTIPGVYNVVKVNVVVPFTSTAPRFRIFIIDREVVGGGAKDKLNPKEICGVINECILKNTQEGQVLDKDVAVNGNTDEILLLASGPSSAPSSFSWSFGPAGPQVNIVEPTASISAFIGHPQNPSNGRRPFLVKLVVQDKSAQNIPVEESDLEVSIPNCADPNGCVLTKDEDIGFLGLSGNNVLLVVNVPVSYYPTGEGTLDLEIKFHGVKDKKVGALLYSPNEKRQATMLVMDASGSMDEFGGSKLEAAKIVAKAIIASMVPLTEMVTGPMAGIVTFSNDASTLTFGADKKVLVNVQKNNQADFDSAIDAIQTTDSTSIGDGALEAQSILAEAFDILPDADRPHKQAMIIVSDGLNNESYTPVHYYSSLGDGGHLDGNGQWFAGPLDRTARKGKNLPLPTVSTIAIGQDADGAELLQLARYGGGTMLYIPGPEQGGVQFLKLTVDFADAFGSAFNSIADYDRVPVTQVDQPIKPHHAQGTKFVVAKVQVEPGASELRVSIVSGEKSFNQVSLRSPSGVIHDPNAFASETRTAVFRIAAPEPGTWNIMNVAGGGLSGPSVFVEATVRSRITLFTSADVASLEGPPEKQLPVFDAGNWWGSDVYLRALLNENGPVKGCEATATVTLPVSGKNSSVSLRDDGKSSDGLANDGTYGFKFSQTKEAGLYVVRYNMKCVSPVSGVTVEREENSTFELHRPNDLDKDKIYDLWEQRYGLNPNDPTDALTDSDGDGLNNYEESIQGTNPFRSDSDGGGESDGSETKAGRNPSCNTKDDRAASEPMLWAIPGNGRAFVLFGMTTSGIRIEIDRGSKIDGPFTQVTKVAGNGQISWSDMGLANEVPVCYRGRTVLQKAVSGWSPVICVTPRGDPDPPVVMARAIKNASDPLKVTLFLNISDPPLISDGAQFPFERGVVSSGPSAIRISMTPSFKGINWQPAESIVAIQVPNSAQPTLWVQARDAAGNVSTPQSVGIQK